MLWNVKCFKCTLATSLKLYSNYKTRSRFFGACDIIWRLPLWPIFLAGLLLIKNFIIYPGIRCFRSARSITWRSRLTCIMGNTALQSRLMSLLASVLHHVLHTMLASDLTAPMKFTFALWHLGEVMRVIPVLTAQEITAILVSGGHVTDAIFSTEDSQCRIPVTVQVVIKFFYVYQAGRIWLSCLLRNKNKIFRLRTLAGFSCHDFDANGIVVVLL